MRKGRESPAGGSWRAFSKGLRADDDDGIGSGLHRVALRCRAAEPDFHGHALFQPGKGGSNRLLPFPAVNGRLPMDGNQSPLVGGVSSGSPSMSRKPMRSLSLCELRGRRSFPGSGDCPTALRSLAGGRKKQEQQDSRECRKGEVLKERERLFPDFY